MNEERLEILRKVQAGELTVEEGFTIISLLDKSVNAQHLPDVVDQSDKYTVPPEIPAEPQHKPEFDPGLKKWRVFGWAGFSVFVVITALSAVWMVLSFQNKPWSFGFWFAWLPFIIGILGMVFTFNARWIHIRIRQKPGEKPQNIKISMPVPFGLINTFLNLFPNTLPKDLREKDVGGMVREMSQNLSSNDPLHIVVNDEDGEHVEIYIG